MSTTAFAYSERFLDHDTGEFHPERSERLRAIHKHLTQADLLKRFLPLTFEPAPIEAIERVHERAYIERVDRHCKQGADRIDTPDCPISKATYDVARLAVGAGIAAVDAVMAGKVKNAFCCVRPPGHHAEHRSAMGFCFFNSIAIAAEHLRAKHGVKRLAILDWDVHHGNGTQHHFESDPDVLFCSIHQHPATLFPGTGYESEKGKGKGEGATLNVTMQPGDGDDDYRRAMNERIFPAIDHFAPEFLLVSAGFDAHQDDMLAQIQLTTPMFGWMTEQVVAIARKYCKNRLVSLLEGGYALHALAESVGVHLENLQASQ